jgi:hypothetical protein
MNWFANLNTAEIVSRDRSFCVVLRPGPAVERAQVVDVEVKASTLAEMAEHGPVGLVASSHILNEATKLAPPGFGWHGDPIVELPT